MTNLNLIANELNNQGFELKIEKNNVVVSLNRNLGLSEVRTALSSKFDNIIDFNLSPGNNGTVLVK